MLSPFGLKWLVLYTPTLEAGCPRTGMVSDPAVVCNPGRPWRSHQLTTLPTAEQWTCPEGNLGCTSLYLHHHWPVIVKCKKHPPHYGETCLVSWACGLAVLCPTAAMGNGFVGYFSRPYFCSKIILGSKHLETSSFHLLLTLPSMALHLDSTSVLSLMWFTAWLCYNTACGNLTQRVGRNLQITRQFHSTPPYLSGAGCHTCMTPNAGQVGECSKDKASCPQLEVVWEVFEPTTRSSVVSACNPDFP